MIHTGLQPPPAHSHTECEEAQTHKRTHTGLYAGINNKKKKNEEMSIEPSEQTEKLHELHFPFFFEP